MSIGQCKQCGSQVGILKLNNGICKPCSDMEYTAINSKIKFSTLDNISGYKIIDTICIVTGMSIITKNILEDNVAYSLIKNTKGIFDGKARIDIKIMKKAKDDAINDLLKEANNCMADAVVGVRYSISSSGKFSEIMTYGTAVKLKKQCNSK